MPYYGEFGEGVLSLSKTKEGLNFLQNTKIKEIINSCFAYFWFMDSKSKKVTIHSQCLWPSNSESSRKESLIKQIKRRINQKIKDGQLRGRKNGIIAFNFEDFIFMNYWDKSNICYQQNLDELTDIIQGCFKDKSEEEILGVLIYYDSLKKSAFIQNPLINIDREIISKIESL
ncbi:MAG: hypothetical protein KJ566_03265 [Nanoarchaeota archaeon]|nr:hypothetical protein [Nanoarchaeota archaeon]